MKNSRIEWCDHTLNFWYGCTKVSPACERCYAETLMDRRFHRVKWGQGKPRVERLVAADKEAMRWNKEAEKAQTQPRVFVNSLSDWLDPEVPLVWLECLLNTIRVCTNLNFLLLTKRPEKFLRIVSILMNKRLTDKAFCRWLDKWKNGDPPNNVWVGVTAETQEMANRRIPQLMKIPAKIHYVSCEPLLENICLLGFEGVDWVICGGETGSNARLMNADWVMSLRNQCRDANIPFFFKKWGMKDGDLIDGVQIHEFPK